MGHIKDYARFMALAFLTLGIGACDSIPNNESSKEEVCDVQFTYKYNMEGVDAFHEQVSAVTLYIFDADSTVVHQWSESGEALTDPDYRMHLPFDLTNHHLIAWAHTEGCNTTQIVQLNTGSHMKDLTCRIGGRTVKPDGSTEVCEIGPVFHGKVDNPVVVKSNSGVPTITIPMTKNTNTLVVNLSNTSANPLRADNFNFIVIDDNGLMAYDNTLLPDTELTYVPHTKREERVVLTSVESRATKLQNVVTAEFTLGRLMANKNPRLTVTNRTTGKVVFSIPFVDYLKLMMSQCAIGNMSDQEYLDHEDSYNFTFFLDENGNWLDSSVLINSWRVVLNNGL